MSATAKKIDPRQYAELLTKTLPRVITTEKEHTRMLGEIRRTMDKGETLSREETLLLQLMALLVNHYEATRARLPRAEPHEILQELMQARGLRQRDLVSIFGSDGYVSDVVNGKRGISKKHAKSLGEFFSVSPAVFLE
jgi:HTH-type transcriptional regulator/antitoxin HigA